MKEECLKANLTYKACVQCHDWASHFCKKCLVCEERRIEKSEE